MLGVFGTKRDPWEELYDFETNTYFYRHRGTGEFSRTNPFLLGSEAKSSHVPTRPTDPLWETLFDSDLKVFWTDLETGKVAYIRPEKGTFISEIPLKDFRRAATKHQSRASIRKSTATQKSTLSRKSMRVVKRDDDFGIVSADSSDLDFEKLFGNASPAHFDAGAMYGVGATNSTTSVKSTPITPVLEHRRLSTRDGGETPDFPVLDEEAVLAQSTIVTDNPLFKYGK